MGWLVWLFAAHRDLWLENQRLLRLIADLEYQLNRPPEGVEGWLKQHQDEVLQEVPFKDGKIPNEMWLTPGEDDRGERVDVA